MTGPSAEDSRGQLQLDGVELRQRLATVAIAIACTEDQVAETLERMALVMPDNAARLRAHAAQARQNATLERSRASMFSVPALAPIAVPQPRRPSDRARDT